MARLKSFGFELNSTASDIEWTSTSGSPTIQTTTVRSGTYAGQITSLTSSVRKYFEYQFASADSNSAFFLRAYFRFTTFPSAENTIMAMGDVSFNIRSRITVDNLGVVRLYDEDGQLTGTTTLSTGTWYRIELQHNSNSNVNSVIRAQVDGTEFAGSSTRAIGTGISRFRIGGNLNAEAQTTGNWFIDDVAINDSTGSFQNSYPGSEKIIVLRPNAQGDNNGFATNVGGTAGTANNYTRVSETTPDDATSYNASTSGTDEFNLGDTPAELGSSDTINVVAVDMRFSSASTSLNASVAPRIKISGGTAEVGTSRTAPNTSWITISNSAPKSHWLVLYDLPGASTTPWTKADLDTAQAGYAAGANSNATRVTAVWVTVCFTPASGTAYTQSFTESLTLSESFTKLGNKTYAELFSLLESFAKLSSRELSDSFSVTETYDARKTRFGTYTETLSVTDTLVKLPQKMFSEAISLAESFVKQPVKLLSETFTLAEVFAAAHANVRSFAESISLSDTLIRTPQKLFSEAYSLVESFFKKPQRTLTDTITLTEIYSSIKTKVMSFLETYTLTDTLIRTGQKVFSESISLAESFIKNPGKSFSEAISLVESLVKLTAKTFSGAFTLTETFIKSSGRSLADSVSLTEIFVKAIQKPFTETITVAETFTKKAIKALAEAFSITEVFNAVRIGGTAFVKSLSETISLTDSIIKRLTKPLTEQFSISDTIKKLLNGTSTIWSMLTKPFSPFTSPNKPSTSFTQPTKPSSIWTSPNKP